MEKFVKSALLKNDLLKNDLVKCIYEAVGEDIKQDLKKSRIEYSNSKPQRIWDLINRNISEQINSLDVAVIPNKRGSWWIMLVYDKRSNLLYTMMRESRLKQLRRDFYKNKNLHYIEILASSLNEQTSKDVLGQISLLPDEEQRFVDEKYKNQEYISEILKKMLVKLPGDVTEIKNHVLITFENSGYELTKVKCSIVNKVLGIVEQVDWSDAIPVEESVVVDTVDVEEMNLPFNNPSQGLSYKKKATDKKEMFDMKKYKKEDENKSKFKTE